MMNAIAVVSSPSLEKWDWRTPSTTGIGGSETSHIEMAQRLHLMGYSVHSYAPTPAVVKPGDPTGLPWATSEKFDRHKDYKILINYRDPALFDGPKPPGASWWFIAQDVDYPGKWTKERLDKVDRYIVLCPSQASYVAMNYPEIATSGRLYQSSNGICSDRIRALMKSPPKRNLKRLMYASSPDRGLMLLLENWFRIKERVPEAELSFFYGFNNMEKIVEINGPLDWRREYQEQLFKLSEQSGVTNHGRVPQQTLWEHWFQSNIWLHPTDFPETSCITCMEAQACGAIPVTNRLWAIKYNIEAGYLFDGVPQKDPITKHMMIEKAIELLNDSSEWDLSYEGSDDIYTQREDMQNSVLAKFDWRNIAEQWSRWIDDDMASEPASEPATETLPDTSPTHEQLTLFGDYQPVAEFWEGL